jgi:hypothetical protein
LSTTFLLCCRSSSPEQKRRTSEEDLESGTDTSGVAAQSLVLLEVIDHGASDLSDSILTPMATWFHVEPVQEWVREVLNHGDEEIFYRLTNV